MKELIEYLISFLTNCEKGSDIVESIGYTSDESVFSSYKVVIIPSGFFNESTYAGRDSMPVLPVEQIDNIPILYGKAIVDKQGDTIILHADLLASAYFFLSSYEEWIQPYCLDENGRFPGKKSLAYKLGIINRPIVDEYGKLLRGYIRQVGLNLPEPPDKLNKIYLTHDVDVPFQYRTFRALAGVALKKRNELRKAFNAFKGDISFDPFFTFPWIIEQNNALLNMKVPLETVFFIKAGKCQCIFDKPYYDLKSKDIQHLFNLMKQAKATIGLHTSYYSADYPENIQKEKDELEKYCGEKVFFNRNHYLRLKNITNLNYLVKAGITDDFTMGFADVAGFRLGTCKPVKWINPATRQVTNLTLHPLTVMDATLSELKYMNLSVENALNYTISLIEETKKHNGELTLLWHNNRLSNGYEFDHQKLYVEILNYIKNNIG